MIPLLTTDGIEGFDSFESITLVFAGGFVPVDGAGDIIFIASCHQEIKETLTKPYMALKFVKFQ